MAGIPYVTALEDFVRIDIRRIIHVNAESVNELSDIDQARTHMDNISAIQTSITITIKYEKKN
jgi:hypothetical protein